MWFIKCAYHSVLKVKTKFLALCFTDIKEKAYTFDIKVCILYKRLFINLI